MPALECKKTTFVAYCPELDIASCGHTEEKATKNLHEAIQLTMEGAAEDGNLEELLREAGFQISNKTLKPPKISFTSMFFTLKQKISPVKFSYA